ncbi:MAG: hypothetical protein QM820_47030 [Minicystis sp.]
MHETTPTPKKSQANKPGFRTLNLKIPECAFRKFRSEAEAAGLTNNDYFLSLLERPTTPETT